MSIKRHLNALLHRTRGGHSFHKVRESIANMEEQEAQEWYRFITNAVEDAKMQAKNQARNRGGFFASQQRVAARYLDKVSSEFLGELEYYPVTTRGRTTYEVIIEWADDKVWRSKEAKAIQKDLDDTLYDALAKFSKKHPSLG